MADSTAASPRSRLSPTGSDETREERHASANSNVVPYGADGVSTLNTDSEEVVFLHKVRLVEEKSTYPENENKVVEATAGSDRRDGSDQTSGQTPSSGASAETPGETTSHDIVVATWELRRQQRCPTAEIPMVDSRIPSAGSIKTTTSCTSDASLLRELFTPSPDGSTVSRCSVRSGNPSQLAECSRVSSNIMELDKKLNPGKEKGDDDSGSKAWKRNDNEATCPETPIKEDDVALKPLGGWGETAGQDVAVVAYPVYNIRPRRNDMQYESSDNGGTVRRLAIFAEEVSSNEQLNKDVSRSPRRESPREQTVYRIKDDGRSKEPRRDIPLYLCESRRPKEPRQDARYQTMCEIRKSRSSPRQPRDGGSPVVGYVNEVMDNLIDEFETNAGDERPSELLSRRRSSPKRPRGSPPLSSQSPSSRSYTTPTRSRSSPLDGRASPPRTRPSPERGSPSPEGGWTPPDRNRTSDVNRRRSAASPPADEPSEEDLERVWTVCSLLEGITGDVTTEARRHEPKGELQSPTFRTKTKEVRLTVPIDGVDTIEIGDEGETEEGEEEEYETETRLRKPPKRLKSKTEKRSKPKAKPKPSKSGGKSRRPRENDRESDREEPKKPKRRRDSDGEGSRTRANRLVGNIDEQRRPKKRQGSDIMEPKKLRKRQDEDIEGTRKPRKRDDSESDEPRMAKRRGDKRTMGQIKRKAFRESDSDTSTLQNRSFARGSQKAKSTSAGSEDEQEETRTEELTEMTQQSSEEGQDGKKRKVRFFTNLVFRHRKPCVENADPQHTSFVEDELIWSSSREELMPKRTESTSKKDESVEDDQERLQEESEEEEEMSRKRRSQKQLQHIYEDEDSDYDDRKRGRAEVTREPKVKTKKSKVVYVRKDGEEIVLQEESSSSVYDDCRSRAEVESCREEEEQEGDNEGEPLRIARIEHLSADVGDDNEYYNDTGEQPLIRARMIRLSSENLRDQVDEEEDHDQYEVKVGKKCSLLIFQDSNTHQPDGDRRSMNVRHIPDTRDIQDMNRRHSNADQKRASVRHIPDKRDSKVRHIAEDRSRPSVRHIPEARLASRRHISESRRHVSRSRRHHPSKRPSSRPRPEHSVSLEYVTPPIQHLSDTVVLGSAAVISGQLHRSQKPHHRHHKSTLVTPQMAARVSSPSAARALCGTTVPFTGVTQMAPLQSLPSAQPLQMTGMQCPHMMQGSPQGIQAASPQIMLMTPPQMIPSPSGQPGGGMPLCFQRTNMAERMPPPFGLHPDSFHCPHRIRPPWPRRGSNEPPLRQVLCQRPRHRNAPRVAFSKQDITSRDFQDFTNVPSNIPSLSYCAALEVSQPIPPRSSSLGIAMTETLSANAPEPALTRVPSIPAPSIIITPAPDVLSPAPIVIAPPGSSTQLETVHIVSVPESQKKTSFHVIQSESETESYQPTSSETSTAVWRAQLLDDWENVRQPSGKSTDAILPRENRFYGKLVKGFHDKSQNLLYFLLLLGSLAGLAAAIGVYSRRRPSGMGGVATDDDDIDSARQPWMFGPWHKNEWTQSSPKGGCTLTTCSQEAKRMTGLLDRSVNPCQDFYGYVCSMGWKQKSGNRTSSSMEEEAERRVDAQVVAFFKGIGNPDTDLPVAAAARRLWKDCTDMGTLIKLGKSPLEAVLNITGLTGWPYGAYPRHATGDVWKVSGKIQRYLHLTPLLRLRVFPEGAVVSPGSDDGSTATKSDVTSDVLNTMLVFRRDTSRQREIAADVANFTHRLYQLRNQEVKGKDETLSDVQPFVSAVLLGLPPIASTAAHKLLPHPRGFLDHLVGLVRATPPEVILNFLGFQVTRHLQLLTVPKVKEDKNIPTSVREARCSRFVLKQALTLDAAEYIRYTSLKSKLNFEMLRAIAAHVKRAVASRIGAIKWMDASTQKSALRRLRELKVRFFFDRYLGSNESLRGVAPPALPSQGLATYQKFRELRNKMHLLEAVDEAAVDEAAIDDLVTNRSGSFRGKHCALDATHKVLLMKLSLTDVLDADAAFQPLFQVSRFGTAVVHCLLRVVLFTISTPTRTTVHWSPTSRGRLESLRACLKKQYTRLRDPVQNKVLHREPGLDAVDLADNGALSPAREVFDFYASQLTGTAIQHEEAISNITWQTVFYIAYAHGLCEVHDPVLNYRRAAYEHESPHWDRVNVPLSNDPGFHKTFKCSRGEPMYPESGCRLWTN